MKELVLTRDGIPSILLSDEGPEFLNRLVLATCKQYGVTKVFSAAYHSRGHGMVERLNRTIEDRLKHTTNRKCDDWDVWLPDALFAIRSTPHRGTRFSPFRLLYGREPIMPIDTPLLYSDPTMTRSLDNSSTPRKDLKQAASNLAKYHANIQLHLNNQRSPETIAMGSLVYAHQPDPSRGKFAHEWRGPYMVIGSSTGNNNYHLQSIIGSQAQRTTRNVTAVRPFNVEAADMPTSGPFPQLLPSSMPTSGGNVKTAARPRGRGRPKGSKNKSPTSGIAKGK
jgi:hypothetical protein